MKFLRVVEDMNKKSVDLGKEKQTIFSLNTFSFAFSGN